MSDYASCITEPFWGHDVPRTGMAEVHAYFTELGWTEIKSDHGGVAFAAIVRDLSEDIIAHVLDEIAADIAELINLMDDDFTLTAIYNGGDLWRVHRASEAVLARQMAGQKIDNDRLEQAARADRAAKDIAENEGMVNPSLDKLLADVVAQASATPPPPPTAAEIAEREERRRFFEEEDRIRNATVTVAQLRAALATMPQDAVVECRDDGELGQFNASAVWLARSGKVLITEAGAPIYHDEDRSADDVSGMTEWRPPLFTDP